MALTPLRSLIPGPLRSTSLAPHGYYTDGRRLLRVLDAGVDSPYATLEDCLTLVARSYSPGEIIKLRLRPVIPA